MKKVIITIILMLLFSFSVSAEQGDIYGNYREHFKQSGAEGIGTALDDETREFLEDNGLNPENPNWVNKITGENVISHILEFVTSGIKKPARAGAMIMAIAIVTAGITAFGINTEQFAPAVFTTSLAVAAIISSDIWSAVSSAVGAIKGCGTFMLSFIPIFASIVALSGATVTAAAMSGLLLAAAEGITAVAAHGILPLMGGYLAISITSSVSPLVSGTAMADSIKKLAMWVMSLFSTLFVGILSLQTVVNASADNLALKTARFILGTSVPVAGTALSEAVSTITASVGLLRSSIGIYGVVALAVIMLPIIIELILWRLVMFFSGFVCDFFSLSKISGLLKAVDSMLSVLLGISFLVCGMFIISLTVTVTAGKVQ